MKYKELQNGEQIQVGDLILHLTAFGNHKMFVHRLTKKYSYVKYNDVAEGKFPIVYSTLSFSSLPRQRWETTNWKVYRAIKEETIL